MKKRRLLNFLSCSIIAILSFSSLASCSQEEQIDSFTLCTQLNEIINEYKACGVKEDIENKWYSLDENKNDLDDRYHLTGENGTIRIAVSNNEEPFTYQDGNQWTGLCFEYLYELCSRNGYDFEVSVYSSISDTVAGLISNKIDFSTGAISITDEREQSVGFSNPFYENSVICVVKKDNTEITCFDDLNSEDCSIGVLSGSTMDEIAERGCPKAQIYRYNTHTDYITALENGQIDAAFADDAVFRFIKLSHKNIKEVFTVESGDQYGFMCRKFGYQSASELNGTRIGIMEGSVFGEYALEKVPTAELIEYKDLPSLIIALESNKIDTFVIDKILVREAQKEKPIYTFLEPLISNDTGAAFPKTAEGLARRNDFNNFLDTLKLNGELDRLILKWDNYKYGTTKMEDCLMPVGTTNKLKVSISALICPYLFVEDGNYTGLEVELIKRYCSDRSLALEFENMEWSALIPSLSKNDMAVSCISITEERAQSVYFSDPVYPSDVVFVSMADNQKAKSSIFEEIGNSFEKTFIREDRWKLFLEGTGVTLLITAASIVIGLILGFLFYLIVDRTGIIASKIMHVYTSILHNVPIVVILMIFYYIIFGKSTISGTTVSIVVFSLSFSASTYSMISTCVKAIDKGQFEAAASLGYSRNKTFFKIIMPQTFKQFLPMLKDEMVTHIKATAIVGYVAVQDLTKMSDIVRSRTYESFFPLIVTAIIYFLLAVLMIVFVELITKFIDPKKRNKNKILKGVVEHD